MRERLIVACAWLVSAAGWALLLGTLTWVLMTGGPR